MQTLLDELKKNKKFSKNDKYLIDKFDEIRNFLILILNNILLIVNHRRLSSNTIPKNNLNENNIKGFYILPSDVILALKIIGNNICFNNDEYLTNIKFKKKSISNSKFKTILNELKNFFENKSNYFFTEDSENILNYNVQLIIEN